MSIDQDDGPQDEAPEAATSRAGKATAGSAGRDDDEPALGVPEDEQIEPRDGITEAEHLLEIDHLRDAVDKERARATELRDQLVRTAADFDNFRKRTERDRAEERKQASAGLVRSLLPVLDALGRANSAAAAKAETNADLASFVDGTRMIETQLLDVLRQAGLEAVEADGCFDPAHHEALMQEPVSDKPHMTILQVFEQGYRLGGRLVRPARVKVAYNPAQEAAPTGGAGPATDGEGSSGKA